MPAKKNLRKWLQSLVVGLYELHTLLWYMLRRNIIMPSLPQEEKVLRVKATKSCVKAVYLLFFGEVQLLCMEVTIFI